MNALGLRVEDADLETARNLMGGIAIDQILSGETAPEQIVRAWGVLMSAMANRQHNNSVGVMLGLAALAVVITHGRARIGEAISARGWNSERTASEAAMRLFGMEFTLGRKLVPDRRRRDVGRRLLVEAVATSAQVNLQLHSATSQQRYHGMRGVAYLLLARGEPSPSRLLLLEAASVSLAESRRLGDRSAQHSEYAIEILLRRNQIEPSPALLIEAEAILEEVGLVSRRLAYNAGDVGLARGKDALVEGLHEEALAQFEYAVNAYSSGLNVVRRPSDMEDAEIRAKRGYARLRAYSAKSKLVAAASPEELDGIVADLECGEIDPLSGLTPLPEALFWRAAYLRSTGRLEDAILDLTRAIAISPLDAKVQEVALVNGRARCELAECHLERALQGDDVSAIEGALRALIASDSAFDPSIPLLASGIRRMVSVSGPRIVAPLIRETSSKLQDLMRRPHCVGQVRRFAASYTAGVILRLGDLINETELRRVCELYTEAMEGSDEPLAPEILALAADAKIKLAKMLLAFGSSVEESRLLLEDAIELLKASISAADRASEAYDERFAHSRLGEALVRLGSLSGEVQHAENAAQHLERSHSLGNNAPELHGLLGDCYYRIGRAKKNISQLRRASDQKASARSRAAESFGHSVSLRENWSITARIEEAIWQHGGERASIAASIQAAMRAHLSDPQWPWPVFQLASLHRSLGEEFDYRLCLSEELEGIDSRLEAALRQRNAESLEEFGAVLAVEDEEFRRRVLGGRTQVYVLDDPHGLLSGTIVLKRNTLSNAEREAADARSFAAYLRSCGADENFSVAQPLAVVPLGSANAVYAMQHVKGRELGVLVARGHHVGRALLERVVDLLAWFHTWSWGNGMRIEPQPPRRLRSFAAEVSQSWVQLGSSRDDAEKLRSLLVNVLPAWAINLRKKDAHPENWLVTPDGKVVLIDLESTKYLPALYDFCQLLDDYPAFSVDENGMQQRKDLLAKYQGFLAERIREISSRPLVQGDPWTVSCGFILIRAAFGFARLARRENDIIVETTSSALRSTTMRRAHYLKLIDWFARKEPGSAVQVCARHLTTMLEHLNLGRG